MKYRILALVLGGLIYIALWIVALNGANRMIPPLMLPLILGLLVGGGNWLNRFMGIERKPQEFRKRNDEQ